MVHTAIGNENLLKYIQKTASKNEFCTIGLVLGQPTPNKDYIIHVVKTPTSDDKNKAKTPKTIEEISEIFVADHAKLSTRMLSGGMYIIGIFIISSGDVLAPFSAKVKSILSKIHQQMELNPHLCGNPPTGNRLVVNFNSLTQQITCKCYDIGTGAVKPAEFKFQETFHVWKQLECVVDVGQLYPILDDEIEQPLRKHMSTILAEVRQNLENATLLYDGEFKENTDLIDTIGQKKKVLRPKSNVSLAKDSKVCQVTILIPSVCSEKSKPTEIKDCGGAVKVTGQIANKLFLHSSTTIETASRAIREDLIRSYAVRLDMHCDSLTEEENGSMEGSHTIHEPPRRVLVTLEETRETLNDYLFPGEGTEDAVASLDEVLDAKIEENNIVEVEGQADLKEYMKETESLIELPTIMKDTNKFMYYVGVGTALITLAVSIMVHLLFNED